MRGDCLNDDVLNAIVCDDLPASIQKQSVLHLDQCKACQARLEQIAGTETIESDLEVLGHARRSHPSAIYR